MSALAARTEEILQQVLAGGGCGGVNMKADDYIRLVNSESFQSQLKERLFAYVVLPRARELVEQRVDRAIQGSDVARKEVFNEYFGEKPAVMLTATQSLEGTIASLAGEFDDESDGGAAGEVEDGRGVQESEERGGEQDPGDVHRLRPEGGAGSDPRNALYDGGFTGPWAPQGPPGPP